MQDINSWAIAIIGGAIATVIGGLLLKAIGNITIPEISPVAVTKAALIWLVALSLWFIGALIAETVYAVCQNYGCGSMIPSSVAILIAQLTTFIGTIAILRIASRLFKTPNK